VYSLSTKPNIDKILKEFFGKILRSFIYLLLIYILMQLLFNGPVLYLTTLYRAIIILPFTFLYFYMSDAIFMYSAIFIERAQNLYRVYGMVAFFIGGGLVPTVFFPNFVEYLPTTFIFYAPLNYIINGTYPNLFLGLIYFFTIFIILLIMEKTSMRRLETNGG